MYTNSCVFQRHVIKIPTMEFVRLEHRMEGGCARVGKRARGGEGVQIQGGCDRKAKKRETPPYARLNGKEKRREVISFPMWRLPQEDSTVPRSKAHCWCPGPLANVVAALGRPALARARLHFPELWRP